MRLLPMFYLVFLFGFYAIPRMGSGGLWYMMDMALWKDCDQYWWANMLLVGNFLPSQQDSKGGCMQWSWAIAAEFQLYLLIPFYVIIYKKSRMAGIIIGWLLIIAGTAAMIVIADINNFTAGIYTVENADLYNKLIIKPYCKIQAQGLGVLSSILYFDVLAYRKVEGSLK